MKDFPPPARIRGERAFGKEARATKPNLTPQEAEQLVDTYADLILRLSYTYLKNTQDAQDICQTVFLKFVEKPRTFRSPEHEKAWIIRAAVLALTVTAGAAGALKPAAEAFSGLFGIVTPAQTEVIDHIGYPIGASDTDNGITVTADAIMADRYSYAVVYSVVRADGSPLFEGLEDPLTVQFDDWDLNVADFQGGGHGTCLSWSICETARPLICPTPDVPFPPERTEHSARKGPSLKPSSPWRTWSASPWGISRSR